jgi:hypothetical protein
VPFTVLESPVPEGATPSYAAASETLGDDGVMFGDDNARATVAKLAAQMRMSVVEILAPGALSRGELMEQHCRRIENLRVAWIDSKGGDDFFLCDGGESEYRTLVELVIANDLKAFEEEDEQNCVGFMRAVSKGHFQRAMSFWNEDGEFPTFYSTRGAPFVAVDPDELKARAKAWVEAYKERKTDEDQTEE